MFSPVNWKQLHTDEEVEVNHIWMNEQKNIWLLMSAVLTLTIPMGINMNQDFLQDLLKKYEKKLAQSFQFHILLYRWCPFTE
jgi:hypothetical protein